MSDLKNYLGKKREIIFSIVKKQKTSKNLVKLNNESKSKKNNSNLAAEGDSSDQPYSLSKICKLVFEFLKKTGVTTSTKVTEHILNILKLQRRDDQFKNIQRRVYDSINVMSAAGVIKKDNKEIRFLGNENEKKNPNTELREEDSDEYIKEKMKELEEKKKYLIKRYLMLKFKLKYQKLNETCSQRKSQKKLSFPFDLFVYNCSSPMKIVQNEDSTRAILLSSNEVIHYSPYDIIKRLVSRDILSKLKDVNGNSNEKNLKPNITTPKKNTNGESLNLSNNSNINIIINSNDNNKDHEERKNNKDMKKIISNDYYNNFNASTPNKTKINNKEKDDFLVLNYLKNYKGFKDELIFKEEDKKEKIDNNNIKVNSSISNGNRFRINNNNNGISNNGDENLIKKNIKDTYIPKIGLFKINKNFSKN